MYVRVLIDHKKKRQEFFLFWCSSSSCLTGQVMDYDEETWLRWAESKRCLFFLFGWRLIELRCFLLVSKRQGLEWNSFGFFSAHLCLCKCVCVCVCYRAKKAKRSWRGGGGKKRKTASSPTASHTHTCLNCHDTPHTTLLAAPSKKKKKVSFFFFLRRGVNVCKRMCAQSSQAPCAHPDRQEKRQLRSTAHIKKKKFPFQRTE